MAGCVFLEGREGDGRRCYDHREKDGVYLCVCIRRDMGESEEVTGKKVYIKRFIAERNILRGRGM